MYENPRLVQRYYEEHFAAPLEALVETLSEASEAEEARYSSIMETVKSISEWPEFAKTAGELKLILVSDLLQNMPSYSQYKKQLTISCSVRTMLPLIFLT